MGTRICFAYRLKEGIDPATYERWVREVDAPFATKRSTLLRYECVRVSGRLGSDQRAPIDYVELLEVTDVETDQAAVSGPEAERIAAEWRGFVQDEFIVFGDPVSSYLRAETAR